MALAIFGMCVASLAPFHQQSQELAHAEGDSRCIVKFPAVDDADDVCQVGVDKDDPGMQCKVLKSDWIDRAVHRKRDGRR